MAKERNHAFDILCGICIIRMVTLHIMAFCGKDKVDWWLEVMQWSYFFMSFFFFKAGYFNKGTGTNDKEYLTDRCKRLLIPYLSAGLIGLAIYFAFYPHLTARYKGWVEPLQIEHIWENAGFYGNGPVWFLFSFFCVYILVHYIEKIKYLHWIVIFFPLISYLLWTWGNPLWMSTNNVFMATFFFYLGRLWHILMQRYSKKQIRYLSLVLTVIFIAVNFIHPGKYVMSYNEFSGCSLTAVTNATCALCGLSGLLLTAPPVRIPILCFIGEHSMVYFISHYPMLYFYKFMHLSYGRSIYNRWDDVLILIPAVFCICSWFVPYIEQIPWLSGRWKSSTQPRLPLDVRNQPGTDAQNNQG